MREQHKEPFFSAANQFSCWIGLREPNPLSDKWIGRAGYVPKPVSCKAKTGDNPRFSFAGLVVNPFEHEDAFTARTLADAKKKWETFVIGNRLPVGYALMAQGPTKGLLQLHGASIFADFDLMAIIRSNEDGEFLETSSKEQMALLKDATKAINDGLGTPMIQHGSEMTFRQGVGARASERIFWFGPGERFRVDHSSMPTSEGARH